MKKFFIIFCFLISFTLFGQCKEIKIFFAEYEPFIFIDSRGEIRGFDYDILKRFCDKYHFKCNFIQTTFTGLLNAVKNGLCDIAAGSIYITEERKQYGLFTIPYLNSGIVVVVPYNKEYSLNDLFALKVGVKKNATGHRYIQNQISKYKNLEVKLFDSTLDSFKALEYGYIDWLINDYYNSLNLIYTRFRGQFKILSINKNPLFLEKSNIAFYLPKKDVTLLKLLNEHIIALKKNNELNELVNKWFYITKPISLNDYISFIIIFTVLIVSLIFFIVIFYLAFKSNKKLKSYNSFLTAVINLPSYVVFITDKNGNIVFWNKGAELIIGLEKPKTINEIMGFSEKIQDICFDKRSPLENYIVRINTSKGVKTILFDIYPISGISSQFAFFGQDLTELLDSINYKILYENLFYTIIENSPNGVILIDEEMVFLNKKSKEIFNIEQSNIYIYELKNENIINYLNKFKEINTEEYIFYDITDIKEDFIFDIYLKKITTSDKTYYLLILIDNTEKIKQQKLIQEIQRDEIISNLVTSVVHDINNILSVITNYSTLLKFDKNIGDQNKEIVDKILKITEESSNYLKSLLNLSNIGDETKLVFIDNFLKSKENFFRQILGTEIKFDLIIEGKGVTLNLNDNKLTQTLLNLLLNSKDAIESAKIQNGQVTLRKTVKENNLIIEVTDNGTGIPEHLKNKIFNPFFTTKKEKGTGIGLYAAKIFIEELGGKIEVESEKGLFTKFRIIIPLTKT